MPSIDDAPRVEVTSRAQWRAWLAERARTRERRIDAVLRAVSS